MPLFEVPITAVLDAASEADAVKKAADIEKMLPTVRVVLASKGVKSIVVGKPKVKT